MTCRTLTRDEPFLVDKFENWQRYATMSNGNKYKGDPSIAYGERVAFLQGVQATESKSHVELRIKILDKQCQEAWESAFASKLEDTVKRVRDAFVLYGSLKRQLDAWKVLYEEIEE